MKTFDCTQRFRDGGLVGGDQVIPPPRTVEFTVTVTGRLVPRRASALVLDGEFRDITESGKPALPKP